MVPFSCCSSDARQRYSWGSRPRLGGDAVGALGPFVLAVLYGRVTYAGARQDVLSTTATSGLVLLLA